MNIRKHWKKICLAVAAIFWAGCNDDNGTKPVVPAEGESSSSVEQSSSSVEGESSSSTVNTCEDASMYSKEITSVPTFSGNGTSSNLLMDFQSQASDSLDPAACQDSASYPEVLAGTDIRCNVKSISYGDFLAYIKCCDGSSKSLKAENIKNDTLYSDSLLKVRNARTYSETYCKENGGVIDYKVYQPSALEISSVDCDDIAKQKALENYADSTGDTVISSVKSCMHMMSEYALLYGVTPRDTSSQPLSQLTCADSTVITVEEYTALLESYNQKKNCCEAQAEGYKEQAAECFENEK